MDQDARDVVAEPPASVFGECRSLLHGHVVAEFLESQIEVSTGVSANLAEARADPAHLRRPVSQVAGAHGPGPVDNNRDSQMGGGVIQDCFFGRRQS